MTATPAGSSNNQLFKWAKKIAGAVGVIPAGSVTNAMLADMAASTFKGRDSGGGAGPPQDLSATQATALLNTFTNTLKGLVPLSGGGTTNFLRADGAFAAPATFVAATQAEQEAASSLTVGTTPGRQHFSPSALKAWVRFNSGGTISSGGSYGVTSVTDGGALSMTVNFTTAFSSATAYSISGSVGDNSPDSGMGLLVTAAPATTSCRLGTRRWFDAASADPNSPDLYSAMFAGDQ